MRGVRVLTKERASASTSLRCCWTSSPIRPEARANARCTHRKPGPAREQFLARFGDGSRSIEAYRNGIEELFNRHTQHYPVVTEAIDFSRFFGLAEQYRERYRAAATVYRALFEGIDDSHVRVDATYDHYARTLQSALDGYVDCVLTADPSDDEFERYAGALEAQSVSEPRTNEGQLRRALDALEDRRV